MSAEAFSVVAAVENDPAAAATYGANFGHDHVVCGDIAEWTGDLIPTAEVVIGGPPCQGFSTLGTRDPNDPRNRMWEQYVRVVEHVRPAVFVLENVPRFLKSDEFGLLERETQGGRLAGYDLVAGVLNAADYGVPQRRRRAVVLGSRVGRPNLPVRTHARDSQEGLSRWVTAEDAIADVGWDPEWVELPETEGIEIGGRTIPGPFKASELHLGRWYSGRSLARYAHIPPGGNRFNLPEYLLPPCWVKKRTSTTDVMGRMVWGEPSLTIRTEFFKPEKGRYLHPQYVPGDPSLQVNRAITHLEALLLQGFGTDHLWCGAKVQIARQIGNAVPPPLGRAIAREVVELLEVSRRRRGRPPSRGGRTQATR